MVVDDSLSSSVVGIWILRLFFLWVEDASLSKLLAGNCSPKDYSSLSWGIDSKK